MPSTVIKSFRYRPGDLILTIIFVTGKVYAYKNVPKEVYLDMKTAFSKGTFFNEQIRDKYDFDQIA